MASRSKAKKVSKKRIHSNDEPMVLTSAVQASGTDGTSCSTDGSSSETGDITFQLLGVKRQPAGINYDSNCRLCAMIGHYDDFDTYDDQLAHVKGHLCQAAELLGVEECALPPEEELLSKCFDILPDYSNEMEEDPVVPAVAGGTILILECKPLIPSGNKSMKSEKAIEQIVQSVSDLDHVMEEESPQDQEKDPACTSQLNRSERSRRNKEVAVEQLINVYNDPLQRTNFHLIKSTGIWPLFVSDGYRYRLSRVYNNGKVELRCTSDECRGKGIIRPDGAKPYHLEKIGTHSHRPVIKNIVANKYEKDTKAKSE